MATTAKTAKAKAAPKAFRLDPTKCSGKWSRCGGRNPRKSPSWGICVACDEKRTKAMKAARGATAKPAAKAPQKASAPPKPATGTPTASRARRPPQAPREPVARVQVAAMVAPTVTPVGE